MRREKRDVSATEGVRVRWREAPPSELRQGSGGAAPSGVQGRSPWRGDRGAEPPEIFKTTEGPRTNLSISEV